MRTSLSNFNSSTPWMPFTFLLHHFLLLKIHHSPNLPWRTRKTLFLGTLGEKAKLLWEIQRKKAKGTALQRLLARGCEKALKNSCLKIRFSLIKKRQILIKSNLIKSHPLVLIWQHSLLQSTFWRVISPRERPPGKRLKS